MTYNEFASYHDVLANTWSPFYVNVTHLFLFFFNSCIDCVPMIPLGLKETREVDSSVAIKVRALSKQIFI